MKLGRQIANRSFWKVFYTATSFLGLVLMYCEIFLYRKTFVKIELLVAIVVFVGFLTYLLFKNHYKLIYNLGGNFFPLMQSFVSYGFIASYLFMAANYYLADTETVERELVIKSKSSLLGYRISSKRQPTINIEFAGVEKEIVFYSSYSESVENAIKLKMFLRKGLVGFYVIDSYKIVDK